MNSIKFKEERSDIISSLEAIKTLAETEDRDLTSDENDQVDGLLQAADDLSAKIERAEKLEKQLRTAAAVSGAKVMKPVIKEIENYSFIDAIKQARSGKLEGMIKEFDQEARTENPYQTFRGIAIPHKVLEYRAAETAATSGTEVMSFTDQLEANLVLASAGANVYTGVADMKFPIVQSIASSWAAETGSTVTAAGGTTSMTLSPKKLISIVDMTAEAMTQNAGLEAAIRRNMAASIASTWEKALLSKTDVTNAPQSIFADATATSTGVTAADFIGLEVGVLGNNVPLEGARMAYLFDKDAYSSIRQLLQTTGVAPLWNPQDKRLNNYFGFFSTNVGSGGTADKAHALFGDFSRVHLAQFGGLDLMYDPYTQADHGMGRLVATSLVDGNATDNATAFANLIEA
jgi:HK97 family phage major capsid protein